MHPVPFFWPCIRPTPAFSDHTAVPAEPPFRRAAFRSFFPLFASTAAGAPGMPPPLSAYSSASPSHAFSEIRNPRMVTWVGQALKLPRWMRCFPRYTARTSGMLSATLIRKRSRPLYAGRRLDAGTPSHGLRRCRQRRPTHERSYGNLHKLGLYANSHSKINASSSSLIV